MKSSKFLGTTNAPCLPSDYFPSLARNIIQTVYSSGNPSLPGNASSNSSASICNKKPHHRKIVIRSHIPR